MKPTWEDLDARARGLGTHLLTRSQLDSLAQAPDVATLGAELRRVGYPVAEEDVSPAALDLAVRRTAAARLRILARWCGPRVGMLAVLFEDEERRSLRAVLRGAVQGIVPDARLAGLVPTRALPERALQELARQPNAGAVAALLVAWRHPYGSVLLPDAAAAQPDLFRLEVLLNRAYAARALSASRKAGALLTAYVREVIDLENAYTALVLAAEGKDVTPKDAFLVDGARVTIAAFEEAVATQHPDLASRRLAAAFRGTPLAWAFERYGGDVVRLEDAVLRVRIRELVRASRTDPLGPAPLLTYALRLRAEALDLRRVIWGVALGAPRGVLVQELVSG